MAVTTTLSQTAIAIPGWTRNVCLMELSGRLLGAHVAHPGLIILWASLFERCCGHLNWSLCAQG